MTCMSNYSNFHDFIYSIAISPSATKVVPFQQFIWPWQALKYSLVKLFTRPDIDIWVNIITAVIFLILLALSWRKLRLSYRLYSLGITWVSFSYYTGSVHPYMGLPRHLFLAFPVFIGLAVVIKKQWMRLLFLGCSAVGMSFLLVLYVLNTWVHNGNVFRKEKRMKLSIIIPVYNEEDFLEKIVDQVFAVDLGNVEKEIIISDDGSQDQTHEIIQKLQNKIPGINFLSFTYEPW